MEVTVTERYKINTERVVWSILPDEILITDKTSYEIFGLKDIALAIWLHLEKGDSIENITYTLIKKYNISYEIMYSDIKNFIIGLSEMNLIIKYDENS